VDTGELRDSARVTQVGDSSYAVEFTAPYAMVVHERLDLHHPRGGQAKFLEAAVQEARRGFGERVAKSFAKGGK
jgi:hypothetical protein